ncbi:MAG: GNAT family N-acetyltransferase [Nitratireductor sp.]|nr:GNAT family N-acetyltransferase [Nitratireductor sp.]
MNLARMDNWRDVAVKAMAGPSVLQAHMWDYYWSILATDSDNLPVDETLVVMRPDDQPVAILPLASYNGKLDYLGQPATAMFASEIEPEIREEAQGVIRQRLAELALETGSQVRWVDTAPVATPQAMPGWQEKLLMADAHISMRYHGQVRLVPGEEEYKKSLRKRYKSYVNWGRREMETAFHCGDDIDADLFDAFRLFHARIAGRVTRPRQSWDEMYKLAVENRGFLCTGFLGGEMVAATYVFHDTSSALYGTGVYERDLFEKPISHWPMYASIVKCMEMGLEHFDLGEVFLPADASEKEKSIGFFKKGFSQYTTSSCVWTLGQ